MRASDSMLPRASLPAVCTGRKTRDEHLQALAEELAKLSKAEWQIVVERSYRERGKVS